MFVENLDTHTSDWSDLSGMTIKFVLTCDSGENPDVFEFLTADIVRRASGWGGAFGPTRRTVGFTTSAVGTIITVPTKAETFVNTWSVLLERMELLSKIVADIAQVSSIPSLDSSFLNDR